METIFILRIGMGNEAIWLILWLRDEISQAHARALLGRVAHLF